VATNLSTGKLPVGKIIAIRYDWRMHIRNFHGLTDSGEFYRQRDEWMRAVAALKMDPSVRLVCLRIALYTNPGSREARPRQTTLAKELRISVPTVKRAIALAVKRKILLVRRARVLGAARGSKPVNHYSLIAPTELDWGAEVSPMIPQKGITHDP